MLHACSYKNTLYYSKIKMDSFLRNILRKWPGPYPKIVDYFAEIYANLPYIKLFLIQIKSNLSVQRK